MAQTVIKGATAAVALASGVTQKIAAISVTTGQGLFDVSSFGSGDYVDRIGGGLKDLAGSASGFVTEGVSGTNPFAIVDTMDGTTTMTITYDVGCTVSFKAVCGNVTVDINRAGIAVFRMDWSKADDADPTIAWAEGS